MRGQRGVRLPRVGPARPYGIAGAALEAALRRTRLRAGVALVYHRVDSPPSSPRESFDPRLDPALFRDQLAFLAARYRLVTASELPGAVATRERGGRFPVAVTFDDDLLSHVTDATPALHDARAPATFFLNAASLERPFSFWWQRLQRAVESGAAWPAPTAGARSVKEAGQRVEALDPATRDDLAEGLL
ncbi:MAG TPA: polysaccharide deacetylase family protein, partial [Thermoleophilaceae bacterium]|nr:polysaccharide deacetylase family protein [Thermoleophilaceae bacterium]